MPVRLYFFLVFLPVLVKGQSLDCRLQTKSLSFTDSVKVLIKNNEEGRVYFSMLLEKQINNQWVLFSRDVFTDPFSKTSVQVMVESLESKTVGFTIKDPEFFDVNNRSANEDSHKIGVFRIRINFGVVPDRLEKEMVLSEFRTHKS